MKSNKYRSMRMHHVHGRHAILLTTTKHVSDRQHWVHVAWLVRNYRNFGLRLQHTVSSAAATTTTFLLLKDSTKSGTNAQKRCNYTLARNFITNCHQLVSWSLTSRFNTNMAISKTKGLGWRAIPTQWRKASDILTSNVAAFLFSSHRKGKGIERLI